MANSGIFNNKDFKELEKQLAELEITEQDKQRFQELEQEMKQFELSLLESDLAFLLS